jgi:hypothetical protein
MERHVDCLPQIVGAALDEPTESRGESGSVEERRRKGTSARCLTRNMFCTSWSGQDHRPITRTSRRSDAMFLTADVPRSVPMGVAFAVLYRLGDAGFASL